MMDRFLRFFGLQYCETYRELEASRWRRIMFVGILIVVGALIGLYI